MSSSSKRSQQGGIKGFFVRAGNSFYSGGVFFGGVSWWMAQKAAWLGFVAVATTMVTFMPLMLLISKEGQMLEMERIEAKELQNKGYSHRQLQEMGFSEAALHSPSVASLSKK